METKKTNIKTDITNFQNRIDAKDTINPTIKIELDGFSLHYSETPLPGDSFQLHCHENYEIFFFLEGDADYMVEGNQYHLTPHSVLLLSPHVFHGVRVNRGDIPYKRIVININPSFVSVDHRYALFSMFPGDLNLHLSMNAKDNDHTSFIKKEDFQKYQEEQKVLANKKNARNKPKKEVYYEHSDLFAIFNYFQAIIQCHENTHQVSADLIGIYVEALLAQLTLMCQSLSPIPHDNTVSERLSDIIQYLNNHLEDDITLETLEQKFFINRHYLNRIFRKATGTTVMDYLQFKRIILAKELLLNGVSAQEVSLKVGFPEYSTFYRAYCRIHGHSPKEDRI